MAKTYKLTLAGIKPTFENGQAYMVRTNRGDLWIRYIGESTLDDKPIFITEGVSIDDMFGSTIYDKYAQSSRVLFATHVSVKGYEDIDRGFSGAVDAGKRQEYTGSMSHSGVSGMTGKTMKQAAKPGNNKYSSYSKRKDPDEVIAEKLKVLKEGWWKAAVATLLTWAALYALAETHFGLFLGIVFSVPAVIFWREIKEWLNSKK